MVISRIFKTQGFKNSAWTLFGSVLYPVSILLTTPFFINRLGEEQFGIWILINSTLQIITALNFGLGDAIIKFASQYSIASSYEKINEIIKSCLLLTTIISLIVVVAGFSLSYYIESNNFFKVSAEYSSLVATSFNIALLIFVLKFFDINFLAIFQGFNRYDISSRLSLICRILILAANFTCVLLGLDLVALFSSTLLIQALFLVLEILTIKKQYPNIKLSPMLKVSAIKKILSFGIWSWLQSLVGMITIQIDKLIVGYFSGMEILSYYALGSMLTIQLHTIFLSVSGWIFPAVSKRTESGQSLSIFYVNANTLLLMFGFSSIITVLLLKDPLMSFWLGPEIYNKSSVYIELFLFYNLFLLPLVMPYFFLNGSGFVKHNTVSEFILKTSNILAMVIFYRLFGNVGLVWGLILSTAFNIPLKVTLLRKYALKEKRNWFGLEHIIPSLSIVLFFMSDNIIIKLLACVMATSSFYFVAFKPSTILSYMLNPRKNDTDKDK